MGIGFTGTPIEKADANTQETFGGYVSIYDIEDAKEDKAVGPNRWGSPLVRRNGLGAGGVHEKRKNSLRRKKVKWARHGGHTFPKLDINCEEIAADWSGEGKNGRVIIFDLGREDFLARNPGNFFGVCFNEAARDVTWLGLVLADARNARHAGFAQGWLESLSNKLRCFSVSCSEPRLFL